MKKFFKKLFGIKENYFIAKAVGDVVKFDTDKKDFTIIVKDGKIVISVEPILFNTEVTDTVIVNNDQADVKLSGVATVVEEGTKKKTTK